MLEQELRQVRPDGALWQQRQVPPYSLTAEHEGLELRVAPNPVSGCWTFSVLLDGDGIIFGHGDTAAHAMHRAEREAELRAERWNPRPRVPFPTNEEFRQRVFADLEGVAHDALPG